jgi:hypothetical protein
MIQQHCHEMGPSSCEASDFNSKGDFIGSFSGLFLEMEVW